jgi:YesN/AraC family two-component response regulator
MITEKKYKILYVDDEMINLESFQLAFYYNKSFEVFTASSGFEGLQLLQENLTKFDLVISDMKMPEMDGLTFIKNIKELNNSLPCLILSGYSETDEAIDALNNGIIIDYIMKPFGMDELESILINSIAK